MKKAYFVMGLFALVEVVYKLVKCASCDESILWFDVPGFVYLIYWSSAAVVLLYGVYKENRSFEANNFSNKL